MGLNRFAREKDDNYSTICNRIMKEKNISLKAKGLYALVMSLPPKWDFSVQGIVAISKEESGAIYTAIKELIKEGYCERNMISEKGRFIGCEYKFFNKKKKPQEKEPHNEKPYRDFPHTENEEDNKLFNESNSSSINTPTELNNNKRLSNDNPKNDYPDDFLEFYNAYGYAKSKSKAYQSWKKLSKKDKKAAIDAIPAYKEDCKANDREMKYPSTYLNQRTWEDDFDISKKSVLCYEPIPDDEDKVLRFKRWMRENHAEIEYTEKPLTFDGYMRLQNEYGMDEVCNQLDYIDANIGRFRKSDIEASIKYYFEHQQYD